MWFQLEVMIWIENWYWNWKIWYYCINIYLQDKPLWNIRLSTQGLIRSLRWLDTVFQGQYLPSLSIKYVAIGKVLEKLPPQLY